VHLFGEISDVITVHVAKVHGSLELSLHSLLTLAVVGGEGLASSPRSLFSRGKNPHVPIE